LIFLKPKMERAGPEQEGILPAQKPVEL